MGIYTTSQGLQSRGYTWYLAPIPTAPVHFHQETYTCLALDMAHPGSQVVAGRASGGLTTLSLHTGRAVASTGDDMTDVVTTLAAGAARGPMLAGTAGGHVLVCDPRKAYSVQQRLVAHPCTCHAHCIFGMSMMDGQCLVDDLHG